MFKCLYVYMQIIPSLLVTSEKDFKTQITNLTGLVEMIQVDLADGEFVPNTTWAYQDSEGAQEYLTDIDFELHLMVNNPLDTIKKWINNTRLKRVLVHFESTNDIESVLDEIQMFDKDVGIVLNPKTSIFEAEPYFNQVSSIMLMGVNPGFQGQKFIEATLERIKKIKELDSSIYVEVDGGVNEKNILKIQEAGADAVCPGSAIFNERSVKENIDKLKVLLKS
ncbi:MAG: ribulose-phosphate 3-epimerase [bacterium]|nr:ribulose-phosphate 3-epimerase [bacterium]